MGLNILNAMTFTHCANLPAGLRHACYADQGYEYVNRYSKKYTGQTAGHWAKKAACKVPGVSSLLDCGDGSSKTAGSGSGTKLVSGSDQNPISTRTVTRAWPQRIFSKPTAHQNKKRPKPMKKRKGVTKSAPKKYKRKR
jgi:hypothetical protein